MIDATVSVIVPTYNRASLLRKTLTSLTQQTLCKDAFEVVVVDDGSSDETKHVVTEFERALAIKYIYQPDLGFRVARARNLGLKLAEGDVCTLIDSGVVLVPGCLAAHRNLHLSSAATLAVNGYMLGFSQDDENAPMLLETIERHGVAGIFTQLEQLPHLGDPREPVYRECADDLARLPAPWVLFWTCNVSVPRKALLEAGGFDEHYRSWGCEDVDLGCALFTNGARFALCREAVALHYPHAKSQAENARSSATNRKYMHEKYGIRATELLLTQRCLDVNRILVAESTTTERASLLPRGNNEARSAQGHSEPLVRPTRLR